MHYQLNTGKTVTWYTSDEKQRVTTITYPISHQFKCVEDVVTCADTILYLGEARELQVQQWQGHANPRVCRFFDPNKDLTFQGHLGPVPSGQVNPLPSFLLGGTHAAQNIIMMNQSNQQIVNPSSTIVGTATPLDHPDAPTLMCDWSKPDRAEKYVIEDKDGGQQMNKIQNEKVKR